MFSAAGGRYILYSDSRIYSRRIFKFSYPNSMSFIFIFKIEKHERDSNLKARNEVAKRIEYGSFCN